MADGGGGGSRVRLAADRTALVVVDMQERLMAAMPEEARGRTVRNVGILLSLSGRMGLPAVATEQYPKGLGRTIPEVRDAVADFRPVEKIAFSSCGAAGFMDRITANRTRAVVVAGTETHVCVFQTVCDLLDSGLNVHVPSDAVCSRTASNWEVGLRLMERAGAVITSTETVVFDVLRVAGTDDFKFMAHHRLKARLNAGETVFGVFLGIPAPPMAEIAGWAGFDFVFADTEHGPGHSESVVGMVRAAEAGGTEALVRVTSSERTNILRALDAGASGVLVPQVNSKEEAERAGAAAHYPPDGVRGIAFSIRAARYGLRKPAEYLAAAKEETLVCVQVESGRAVERVAEIASVPLIDVLFVGPTDLSMNLGHPGDPTHPEVEEAIDRIFEAALASGKVPAILANDVPTAEKWMAKGARMLAANGTGILSKGMADLQSGFRSLTG